jgi:hypothetical protein
MKVGSNVHTSLMPWFLCEQPVESRFKQFGNTIKMPQDFDWAVGHVMATLETWLMAAFPREADVKLAVELAHEVIAGRMFLGSRGSSNPLYFHNLFRKDQRAIEGLNIMQEADDDVCEMIVRVFNSKTPLTEDEKSVIRSILLQVCRAAVMGIWNVVEIWKRSTIIVVPEVLTRHEFVYLDDNASELG